MAQGLLQPEDDVISPSCGRIADTGVTDAADERAVAQFSDTPGTRILWASPRETLNIYQADECGCQIITAPAISSASSGSTQAAARVLLKR